MNWVEFPEAVENQIQMRIGYNGMSAQCARKPNQAYAYAHDGYVGWFFQGLLTMN